MKYENFDSCNGLHQNNIRLKNDYHILSFYLFFSKLVLITGLLNLQYNLYYIFFFVDFDDDCLSTYLIHLFLISCRIFISRLTCHSCIWVGIICFSNKNILLSDEDLILYCYNFRNFNFILNTPGMNIFLKICASRIFNSFISRFFVIYCRKVMKVKIFQTI